MYEDLKSRKSIEYESIKISLSSSLDTEYYEQLQTSVIEYLIFAREISNFFNILLFFAKQRKMKKKN